MQNDHQHETKDGKPERDEKKVKVAVQTTSGRWPDTGFEAVPEQQKLAVVIERAVHALHLADTAGWIIIVGGQEVDRSRTYRDLNLHGEVVLDFGPRAGGGGRA